jgi:predicted ATP-grasp superfamily ATP-dependent carboligase
MPAITYVFLVLSVICVFMIAAVVIGREARRLDALAPRVVYEIDAAVEFVADSLPAETQARLTLDELRELLIGHMNWLSERNLVPQDVIDRRQDIDSPLIVDETHLAAHLLNEAIKRGVEVLDDVDVIHVVDAHNAYFAAIGAVGPQAESI